MRKVRRIYYYLKFFFEADTKKVRDKACVAAYEWCRHKHQEHWTDNYQTDFMRFTKSYIFNYCHLEATYQLKQRGL